MVMVANVIYCAMSILESWFNTHRLYSASVRIERHFKCLAFTFIQNADFILNRNPHDCLNEITSLFFALQFIFICRFSENLIFVLEVVAGEWRSNVT